MRCTSGWSRIRAGSCTRTPVRGRTEMAAELIEAGVDVQSIYRKLYEEVPFPKLSCWR